MDVAITKMSSKGQVVIPLSIRRLLGLEASDRLYFELEKGVILAKPVSSIEEAMGMVESRKVISKKEYKKTIADKVSKKYQ